MLNALKLADLLQSKNPTSSPVPGAAPSPVAASAAPTPASASGGLALPSTWSQYLGGGGMDDTFFDPQVAQQVLSWAKQFDPAAAIKQNNFGGSYIDVNQQLLPTNITGAHGINGIARGTPGSGERLVNPNLVGKDPIYGSVTRPMNLAEKGPSMVDVLGPLVVAAATGIGAGGLSGLLGGGASSNPIGASVVNGLPGVARNAGSGNFMGALLAALPIAGGAAGIPSYLTRGATTLGQLAFGGKKPIGGGG